MNVRDIHFALPEAAYLFPVVVLLAGFLYWLWHCRQRALKQLGSVAVLQQIVIRRSSRREFLRAFALCAAWILAVLALMQPLGAPRYSSEDADGNLGAVLSDELLEEANPEQEVKTSGLRRRKAHELIFLLDTSASMAVKDTRTGVSRLDYAKEVIDELVSELDGQSAAIYAFTSQVTTVVPSTVDYLYLRLALKFVGINEGDVAGTDLVEALEFVRRRHFKANKEKLLTLVLLTDGGDTRLESLEGEAYTREQRAIVSRVKGAEALNLRVYTVGIGSEQGAVVPGVSFQGQPVRSSLDEDLLDQLASEGRGRYYFANRSSTLGVAQGIHSELEQDSAFVETEEESALLGKVKRTQELGSERELLYDLYFQYPLFLAFIFVVFALMLPETSAAVKEGDR